MGHPVAWSHMFETVLVATDGSESVERAIDTALDLAADFEAAVHAISVVDPAEAGDRGQAEAALDAVVEAADREVSTAVREGDPATEICGYAARIEADLLAMGTRGRGHDSFHLGSVAGNVVERATVPVLTVRQLSGLDRAT